MITCVDLFCGLGGLTHGLARAGVRVVAGVDLDPACRYPYEKNNSATFVERNVEVLTGQEIRALWGPATHTLLAGCAPCQPFSTYSRKGRSNRSDEKWELVAHFGRLVKESKPDFVTMENVPQVVDHKIFLEFLDSLRGYHFRYDIIDCAQYGVPQTRKRLVLLASRFAPIRLIRPRMRRRVVSVRSAIHHLKPLSAGETDPDDVLHSACRLSALNLRRIKASNPGGTWRDWDPRLVAKCHQKISGATYPSVYGRMEWDAPSPTITTQSFGYGNGRFGHPEQNRAITLREAALLQTFPKSYKLVPPGGKVGFSTLGRLIGNAVPVRIGEVIALSLQHHIQEHQT
jgi:DNA (cytosine-5)-methyltransferase 1